MKPVLLVYATREGHTRKITEHLANAFHARSIPVEVHDAAVDERIELSGYSAAVLAASVHMGAHEKEMVRFARDHRAALEAMPSVFLSVSLTEADAEDPGADAEYRERAHQEVELMLQRFFHDTGWHPSRVHAVAGALLYTHYGRLLRFVMKRIARSEGNSTDTTRDHVYTDWGALGPVVDEVVEALAAPVGASSPSEPAHP